MNIPLDKKTCKKNKHMPAQSQGWSACPSAVVALPAPCAEAERTVMEGVPGGTVGKMRCGKKHKGLGKKAGKSNLNSISSYSLHFTDTDTRPERAAGTRLLTLHI